MHTVNSHRRFRDKKRFTFKCVTLLVSGTSESKLDGQSLPKMPVETEHEILKPSHVSEFTVYSHGPTSRSMLCCFHHGAVAVDSDG